MQGGKNLHLFLLYSRYLSRVRFTSEAISKAVKLRRMRQLLPLPPRRTSSLPARGGTGACGGTFGVRAPRVRVRQDAVRERARPGYLGFA